MTLTMTLCLTPVTPAPRPSAKRPRRRYFTYEREHDGTWLRWDPVGGGVDLVGLHAARELTKVRRVPRAVQVVGDRVGPAYHQLVVDYDAREKIAEVRPLWRMP